VTPEGALVLCRFLFDGPALFIWGSSAYLSACVPAELAAELDRKLRRWTVIAVSVAVAATAAMLPLRAATIGNGWPDAFAPSMLGGVLFETDVGSAWIVQACAVALLVVATSLRETIRLQAQAIGAAFMLLGLTVSGHAAMNDGWLRVVHRLNDGLHLLSGGAWLGALVPVLLIMPMLGGGRRPEDARLALMRFSTAGHVAVALVILSGIVNTLLIVGTVPWDWSFRYQRLLSIKILLVAAMAAVAIINRYVVVPRLGRGQSLWALKSFIIAEICLGLAVVGVVAWFGTLQPV
jgi:putative copper resistance protein D